jgi:starch synthase
MSNEAKQLKIALVSPEIRPFAATGGLGDVAAFLSREIKKLGHDIRLFMPNYAMIEEQGHVLEELPGLGGPVEAPQLGSIYAKTALLPDSEVPVYFIGAEERDYYSRVHGRSQLYGWDDDASRFILLCRGVLGLFSVIGWKPDVIHCNDWQTGLIPAYLDGVYKYDFSQTATLYTIHNIVHSGLVDREHSTRTLREAGLGLELLPSQPHEFWGHFNFAKGALLLADMVNTVSPTYSQEILRPEEPLKDPQTGQPYEILIRGRRQTVAHQLKIHNAAGFEDILCQRAEEQPSPYLGILNGIDYDYWSPEIDVRLEARNLLQAVESLGLAAANEKRLAGQGLSQMARSLRERLEAEDVPLDELAFSAGDEIETLLERKRRNKRRLQWLCGLEQREDALLVGRIGRIGDQKDGLLMVREQEALRRILGLELQMVVLGRANEKDPAGVHYRQEFARLDREHRQGKPGRFCFVNERYRDLLDRNIGEEEDYDVEHLIYAGSDAFLLPSLYEPCGLSQMISFRYGTLPIVSKTGGLADTVRHWDEVVMEDKGPGFVFRELSPQGLVQVVGEAVQLYRENQVLWRELILDGMTRDFSWGRSAQEYVRAYSQAIARRRT